MANIKSVDSLKGHWTKSQLADRKEVQENLKNNYDSIDEEIPEELQGYAREEWLRIVPLLKKQTPASNLDRSQLINYCLLAQTVKACQEHITQDGYVSRQTKELVRLILTLLCRIRQLKTCVQLLMILD